MKLHRPTVINTIGAYILKKFTASLAYKYRPEKLDEFIGNEEVKDIISAALKSRSMDGWPMLLVSGPPGVAKTALALSIQRHMICRERSICGQCPECNDFERWSHYESMGDPRSLARLDRYLDLDRSHGHPYGVLGLFGGIPGKRVVILDEAHNISKKEFEVRKKWLEPGGRVFVILVTSEPERIPESIRSICIENLAMKPPEAEEIAHYLIKIAKAEGVALDEDIEGRIYDIACRKPRDVRAAVHRLDARIISPYRSGMKLIGPPSTATLALADRSNQLPSQTGCLVVPAQGLPIDL